MRIGIASSFGCGLNFAARLADEGNDVLLWNDASEQSGLGNVGRGLVPTANGWGEVFDFVRYTNEPALLFFDSSGLGERADEARKAGVHVVGGAGVCDKAEKNRDFGQKLAEDCGATLPECQDFTSVSDAIKYARGLGEQGTYWKSDRYLGADATYGAKDGPALVAYLERIRRKHGDRMRCSVQDKIDGVALSTARWFNGREFVGPFEGTIEHKKLMNDDVGPSTGCALNAVWFYEGEECAIAERLGWGNLAAVLRREEAPPGIYDMNAIVDDDGEPHFLEWCMRCGFDSEPTSTRLIGDLSRFLWYVATGQGDTGPLSTHIAYAVRLAVPPYPAEHITAADKDSPVGIPIRGADGLWQGKFIAYQLMAGDDGLAVAAPEGIVGLALATSRTLAVAHTVAVEYAREELEPGSLMFRTDGDLVVMKDAKRLTKVLPDIPGGLMR